MDGPPDGPGLQLYDWVLLTLMEKLPPLMATVPVAVGFTTTANVGKGKGEFADTVANGVDVTPTVTGVDGIGVPLGLTTPSATIVLLGVICAVASRLGLAVGWRISHVTVTVELGVTATPGVFSSIWNG
ncbi:hypothetical protein [Nonomuraea sp. NPDC049129]|uniref:hypothetical protein n=1 Tax=Nonomuraea sp. NPDC049129 TaxID=3155272 RepID=UPI0033D225F5